MTSPGPWVSYRIVFAAEAPIHIGWHRLGLIERTRYYIPARAMWGVVVGAMAPRLHPESGVPGMYRATEADFAINLRFTCLFAADSANASATVWRPKYEADGLHYGGLTAADFESRFVFSQTSAALNPSTFTALEGALHESEFLWYTHRGSTARKALHFVGYLLCRGDAPVPRLKSGLAAIAIGADRNYGWGRLRLCQFEATTEPLFGQFEVVQGAAGPRLRANSPGAHLPAHLEMKNGSPDGPALKGEVELVGGRDWREKGSGRHLADLALCWAPGSRVESDAALFEVGAQGVWFTVTSAEGGIPRSP